jgi:ribosomal protein L34
MAKRTLSNKGRHSVLKVSGFRARMATTTRKKNFVPVEKKGVKL